MSFARRLLIGVVVIASAIILARSEVFSFKPGIQPVPSGEEVGLLGPVGFEFTYPVDETTVDNQLSIYPAVKGSVAWDGSRLLFYPEEGAFVAGQEYTLCLGEGTRTQTSERITTQELCKPFKVRHPRIVYLKMDGEDTQIWVVGLNGESPAQLTSVDMDVISFDVDQQHGMIFYSVVNELGGSDIWKVNGDTGVSELLLACGEDRCTNPVLSSNNGRLAYSRTSYRDASSFSELFLYDLETNRSSLVMTSILPHPLSGVWSYDDMFIAAFDAGAAGIRVKNLLRDEEFLIQSNTETSGVWSPLGYRLVYGIVISPHTGDPYTILYMRDFLGGQDQVFLGSDKERIEYSLPVFSLSGEYVIGGRVADRDYSKQLYLYDSTNVLIQMITQDSRFVHAAYQWDPTGHWLVFQRYELFSSTAEPEIIVWEKDTGFFSVMDQPAAMPQWLP